MSHLPDAADLADQAINNNKVSFGGSVVELEQEIIGCVMVDAWLVADLRTIIKPQMFYPGRNRIIWDAIVSLHADPDAAVDLVTVTERLRDKGKLDTVGVNYLSDCASRVGSTGNATHYAYILKERYMKRAIYSLMRTTQYAMEKDGETDIFELVEEVQGTMHELAGDLVPNRPRSMDELTPETLDRLDRIRDQDGLTGVPSGFHRLDHITGGWQDSDLIIIAGRPGMGKSTVLHSMGWRAATHHEYPSPGLIVNLEMPNGQCVQRIACSVAGIEGQRARTGRLSDSEMQILRNHEEQIRSAPLWFVDDPGMSLSTLCAHARKLRYEEGIQWIGIDYLQLLTYDGQAGNREQEIAAISRGLKGLAKDLNIPVIALAQLNRSVEQRQDKVPKISDLRESGQIEQDADVISFVYRPAHYDILVDEHGNDVSNDLQVIVAKQRNGPTGIATLGWQGKYPRVVSKAHLEREEQEQHLRAQQDTPPSLPPADDDAPF